MCSIICNFSHVNSNLNYFFSGEKLDIHKNHVNGIILHLIDMHNMNTLIIKASQALELLKEILLVARHSKLFLPISDRSTAYAYRAYYCRKMKQV